MAEENEIIQDVTSNEYKYGFVSNIDTDYFPKGISEEIVRKISAFKKEPEWLLDFRLKAYRKWLTMKEPTWAHLKYNPIDYQDIIYFAVLRRIKRV
jgi:Fe-S cluster assembly protein SufB